MFKRNVYLLILFTLLFSLIAFSEEKTIITDINQDYPAVSDAIRAVTGTDDGEKVPHFVLFLGRFHPLVLHLPIGIIMAIFLLELLIYFYRGTKEHIVAFKKVSILLSIAGGVTGVGATTLGWLLSSSLTYSADALALHGYICTVFSLVFFLLAYLRYREVTIGLPVKFFRIVLVINLILLNIGGHEGGNLTHGEEFLFEHAPDIVRKVSGRTPKAIRAKGSKNSKIYQDLIVSIMNNHCLSCHSKVKVKGELRLDSYKAMLKGGEIDGPALTPKSLVDSSIYYRITINENDDADDEIMPPKGKVRLTSQQIDLIRWWIEIGAPEKGKVEDFKPSEKILKAVKKQDIVLEPVLEKKDNDKRKKN